MPQNRNSSEPPKVMTWRKALPILVVAAIFDVLRLMFEWFWFFGPALAAVYCTLKASSAVGSLGGLTTLVCGLAAGTAGAFGAAGIETFGVIMAMATGLVGWMVIGLFLISTNPRIFKTNKSAFIVFASSLVVSEIPIVGSVPAITAVLWRLYRMQIHKDMQALRKYEEEQASARLAQRQNEEGERMQSANAEQQSQAEEEADEEEREASEEEGSVNTQLPASVPEFGSAAIKMTPSPRLVNVPNYTGKAANEEIPEKVRRAA